MSIFLFPGQNLSFAQSRLDTLLGEPKKEDEFFIVEKIISTDTLALDNQTRVKLIGLSAPNPPKEKEILRDSYGIIIENTNPETSLEEQAIDFAKSLLEKKRVRLEFDAENKDADGHLLVYVFLTDGTFANAEILRQGFANLKIIQPNTKYADTLRKAYQEARKEKRGLQGE